MGMVGMLNLGFVLLRIGLLLAVVVVVVVVGGELVRGGIEVSGCGSVLPGRIAVLGLLLLLVWVWGWG